MSKITREVWIDAPQEQVWGILADFGNVYRINPNVPKSYLTSEQTEGVGTTRHCDFNMMGASVEERIVGWQENKAMQINIYAWSNLPGVNSMGAEFELEEEDGRTRLQGTLNYTMKYGPIGKIMDKMMTTQNTKAWEAFIAGIKHYIETGETVDSKARLNLDAVAVAA